MSRKSKPSKQKKSVTTSLPQVDRYLDLIGQQIFQGNYSEAVSNCERLLNYLPRHAPQRVDVLAHLLAGRFREGGPDAALEFLCARRPVAHPNPEQIEAAVLAARGFGG